MRVPVIAPGGTSTTILSVEGALPSPRQSRHALIARPDPPQSPHVTANCRWPLTRVVFPEPPHKEHAVSREPTAWPDPLQVVHAIIRVTLIVALTPRSDSSKLIETGYSRSWPRSGFLRFWRAETCSKISRKSASRDPEKSKP